MKQDYKKLEIALNNLNKPLVDQIQKDRIKKAVFNNIKYGVSAELGSLKKLQLAIKNLAASVKPSAVFAAKIKERVFAIVEHSKGPSLFSRFIWKSEQIFASLILVSMIAGTGLVYFADIPVTKAAKRTVVQEVYGNVELMRGFDILNVYEGMELNEGDVLSTGNLGAVEVRYCDDSVTRVASGSLVKLDKLFVDEKNTTKTKIEIQLLNGRVWSQVVNIVDNDSSFNVNTEEIKAVANNKASFDIKNNHNTNKTQVAVFTNKVKVSLPKADSRQEKLILEGYSLEVDTEHPKMEKIVIQPKISETEEWVKTNKEKDKQYVKTVTDEVTQTQKNEAGVLPDNPLYTAKKLNEGTKLFVTGDPDEKSKLEINIAVKRLVEANAMFAEGKTDQANQLLDEFNREVEIISGSVNTSDDLKSYAKEQLSAESKKLAVILPDSPLYPAKEALRNAKEKLALNPEEQKSVALEHASEKLVEAKELVDENKTDIAKQTIEGVKDDVKAGIASTEDAASTLADAKILADTVKQDISDGNTTTRSLNKLAQETETALNTELLQAAVTETNKTPEVSDIIPTPTTTQVEVIENTGTSDIAVIIPVEPEEQE